MSKFTLQQWKAEIIALNPFMTWIFMLNRCCWKAKKVQNSLNHYSLMVNSYRMENLCSFSPTSSSWWYNMGQENTFAIIWITRLWNNNWNSSLIMQTQECLLEIMEFISWQIPLTNQEKMQDNGITKFVLNLGGFKLQTKNSLWEVPLPTWTCGKIGANRIMVMECIQMPKQPTTTWEEINWRPPISFSQMEMKTLGSGLVFFKTKMTSYLMRPHVMIVLIV